MTVHTNFTINWPQAPVPIAAGATVLAGLPVAINRAVATAAQELAVGKAHLPPVAREQRGEVGRVVTHEAVVVGPGAMAHHDVRMLGGDEQFAIRVMAQWRRFALLMADVTFEIRQVGAFADEIRVSLPHGGCAQKIRAHQRNRFR